ncbi:Pimeloyl-ACP methyl ester carboxylesterase [Halogranum gelatinilyticum]|uniref:Pimeloyl-ACP methyl ester carboxylesterase n=1 Tax=Halogranum gelatinilyticum TaxID=660521 RepID=A0A1G9U1B1_9EURY|nr:alpha/beta hydrolase [Halogranum gelatinilyticum]SDM53623.1 Pimeloyl-ACP methyl ester carboxylesterase [Halogranum gelatinilyticum]
MTTRQSDARVLHTESTGTGQPLVFVHGGWLSGEMWRPQVDRFADEYRVITVDIRGHGETGATDARTYTVDLFAADLRATLRDLAVDDPILCGLSLGGLVAQTYAADYDVSGLVLADTVESLPPVPMTGLQKQFLFPKPSLYPTFRLLGSGTAFRMLLQSVRAVEGKRWLALNDDVREYALGEVDAFSSREFVKVFDALYEADGVDVSSVDAPSLLLYGDHEARAVVAQNRKLATALDAEMQEIPAAGHLSNLDNAEVFNDVVAGFLDEIGA